MISRYYQSGVSLKVKGDYKTMIKDKYGYYNKKYKGITFSYRTIERINKAIEQHKIFLQYISEGREEEYYIRYPLTA